MPNRIANPGLDQDLISREAVRVVEGLRAAGFDAYLVGGCVRDLLLGQVPKDFDVACAATPEQVCQVFSRVRIVGRRFRIAHVRRRREVIEVATFRRAHHDDDAVRSSRGVILQDNTFGGIDEDAFRRDFTVNALYYDPAADVLHDYCDGWQDIKRGTLRAIGDPECRFREDPVRILRAIRFASKLGLTLAPDTERAIGPTAHLLDAVPPARLFDEFGKLFLNGGGAAAFDGLRTLGLTEHWLPAGPDNGALVRLALANTDKRLGEGKPVTPGFLLAAFFWHRFVQRAGASSAKPRDYAHGNAHAECATDVARASSANGTPANGARSPATDLSIEDAPAISERAKPSKGRRARKQPSDEVLDAHAVATLSERQSAIAIPRRHGYFIRDVWRLQPRLAKRTAQNVTRLLEHRRFRAAYDFLMLRAELDEDLAELAEWWTHAQTLPADELAEQLPKETPKRRPRRRRYARRHRRSGQAADRAVAAP